ncbi:MAG TPA: hypothetical protein VI479_19695 [Blastocatellia bacterium]
MAHSILPTNQEKALTHQGPDKQVKQSEPNRRRNKKLRRQAIFTLIAALFGLSLALLGSGSRIVIVHWRKNTNNCSRAVWHCQLAL